MQLKYIHSKKDYTQAIEDIDKLWHAEAGTPEYNHFEILVELLDAYERLRWPQDTSDPIAALKFHMLQRDYDETDLGNLIGSLERAEKILDRQIRLSLSVIWKLHNTWNIPAESLIKPYLLDPNRNRAKQTKKLKA